MTPTTNIVVRLHASEHQRLRRLSAQTGTSRSKLLRIGLAALSLRDPDTLAREANALIDGRSKKKDGRPGANRTAVKTVAYEERRGAHTTAAS